MYRQKSILEIDERELDKLITEEFDKFERQRKKAEHEDSGKSASVNGRTEQGSDGDVDGADGSLLSEEERKFVDETVSWLRPRDNKDIIMSRIWETLTGCEENAFYTPETQQKPWDNQPAAQPDKKETLNQTTNEE